MRKSLGEYGDKIDAGEKSAIEDALKAAEEAPASCAAMIRAFADAGFPDGAINLVHYAAWLVRELARGD